MTNRPHAPSPAALKFILFAGVQAFSPKRPLPHCSWPIPDVSPREPRRKTPPPLFIHEHCKPVAAIKVSGKDLKVSSSRVCLFCHGKGDVGDATFTICMRTTASAPPTFAAFRFSSPFGCAIASLTSPAHFNSRADTLAPPKKSENIARAPFLHPHLLVLVLRGSLLASSFASQSLLPRQLPDHARTQPLRKYKWRSKGARPWFNPN
jgi:hypothetical protein